ncbi:MAG: hypothetical protein QM650_09845 [Microlunatus sp.]
MICEDCGESNKAGAQFCLFCGAYLEWQDSDTAGSDEVTQQLPPVTGAATTPVPAAPPPAPSAAPPAPAAAPQPVSRLTAAEPATSVPRAEPRPAGTAAQPVQPVQPTAPVHQPTPVDLTPEVPVVSAAPAAGTTGNCPRCGRAIEPKRRFCGHCGEQLVKPGTDAPVSRPSPKRETWWSRLWDSKDRAARRAYRRSLPPLYRWRRAIISILTLVLVGSGLTWVARSSPKAFVMARYYDLTKRLDPVRDVRATTIPPDSSVADSQPAFLVDGDARPWKMAWTANTQGSPCKTPPTTPVIQLSFPATRIKEIEMRAGLLKKNPNRDLEFRPKRIWIAYGNQCVDQDLQDIEHQEHIKLDTRTKVSSIRISVQTAFPDDPPEGIHELLSFTEITLWTYPPLN